MLQRWLFVGALLALLLSACGGRAASKAPSTTPLVIYHAGSLTVPVHALADAFSRQHPEVRFETQAGGSRTMARKISELGQQADILMVADYTVIDHLLKPRYAAWNVRFATNAMVIAYTDRSSYADEINADNWYRILLRDGVVYGHSDPNADPCGYRTLMVWQLAEIYYHQPGLAQQLGDHCPPSQVRPKAVELLALLESGDMDYAFEYLSVAVQHHLRYVSLPPQINLSDPAQAAFYAQAQVQVSGTQPGTFITKRGAPIVYGATIPKNAAHPQLAAQFLAFVLGPEGQAILEKLGQPPLRPPQADQPALLPERLRPLVVPSSQP